MTSDAAENQVETPAEELEEAAVPPTSGEDSDATPEPTAEPTNQPSSIADLSLKMELQGKVTKVDLAGAFVDLGIPQQGFLHISQLSTQRVNNVTDVVNEGDAVTVYVLDVNKKKGRISLTLIKPPTFLWKELEDKVGTVVPGTVVRIESFGAFVDIGAERPGLIHVSELAEEYVGSPESVVSVGDEVDVKIIGVDTRKKQIDLSMKALSASTVVEDPVADDDAPMTAMELAFRRAQEEAARANKKQRKGKRSRNRDAQSDIIARTLMNKKE